MNRQEAYNQALQYFSGDELAANVFVDKYALKDQHGNFYEGTYTQTAERLAKEIFRIESTYPNPLSYQEILDVLTSMELVPGGSNLAGIGNPYTFSSLANCFVIGVPIDSYGAICKVDEEQIQLMKRRGGVGHDLSHIRPKGTPVHNSALTSTGLVPFMERYSNSTREVAQDGRRGALMLTISVNHPDVCDFIDAKLDTNKITGANISVKLSDEFMLQVKNDGDYFQTFPINYDISTFTSRSSMPYNVLEEHMFGSDIVYIKKVKAKEIWEKIIHNAWASAEPGLFFWDTIINESPSDVYPSVQTIATNPCGEVPLPPYDSCRLLAINLYKIVDNPFTDKASVNYAKLEYLAMVAQRIMDDIVDLENEKIDAIIERLASKVSENSVNSTEIEVWKKIKQSLINGRRTGIGTMGDADLLASNDLIYASTEGNELLEKIHSIIAINIYKTSIKLAQERGAFPLFHPIYDRKSAFVQRILKNLTITDSLRYVSYGRRNIASISIAPTGTIAIIAQVSSGIEPVFKKFYKRRKKVNTIGKNTYTDSLGIMWEDFVIEHKPFSYMKSLQNIEETKLYYDYYRHSEAQEIDNLSKIKLQGKIQQWVDHSISNTYNLPSSATEKEVSKLYLSAWEEGCKGITIYRDGSRENILSSVDTSPANTAVFVQHDAPKRGKALKCDIFNTVIKGEPHLVVVGLYQEKPYELFLLKGHISATKGELVKIKKSYYSLLSEDGKVLISNLVDLMDIDSENISRLISIALRHGANIDFIIEQLDKSKGSVVSIAKVIARQLKKYKSKVTYSVCTDCGGETKKENGCEVCMSCGNSKCS